MRSLLKGSLMPGSPMLLLLAVILGAVLLLFGRTRVWGRRWIVTIGLSYWLLSTPAIANGLANAIAGGTGPVEAAEAAGASAIVVLDGGATRYVRGPLAIDVALEPTVLRALETARVYKLMQSPLVIVTGGTPAPGPSTEGQALVNALIRSGIPAERILLDSASSDTRAHAVNVGRMLRERGISRFVLVTSATHMWRSLLVFRRAGLQPIASAAAVQSDGPSGLWRRWMPSLESLRISEQACYDALGLTYYKIRGWV